MLRQAGWSLSDGRVERIWRREGLKVPQMQPKRGRLWLAVGSCIRLRPEHPNHVWSYDFVEDRTHDGRKYRMLNVVDEFTHECLAIRVNRRLKAIDVIDVLPDLFILRGVPGHIRSDNGPEFVAKAQSEHTTQSPLAAPWQLDPGPGEADATPLLQTARPLELHRRPESATNNPIKELKSTIPPAGNVRASTRRRVRLFGCFQGSPRSFSVRTASVVAGSSQQTQAIIGLWNQLKLFGHVIDRSAS